jgi:ABC-2 type transport system permease protein
MSVITGNIAIARPRAERMPFLLQVSTLILRNLRIIARTPAEVLPGIFISVFFVLVYEASLGNASNFLPGLAGKSYLAFILPVSIISSALSGASIAGFSIVRDIENGYFDKLMLTPVSRSALLLAAMVSGAFVLGLQAAAVTGVGLLMGLESATGFAGILVILGYSVLLGTAFAGFTVGVALRTGSSAATSGAGFLFFPLTFLTATFVPLNLLDGWIRTAADYNPVTYMLGAMRAILLEGWQVEPMLQGLAACIILAVITFTYALFGLRARTKQK